MNLNSKHQIIDGFIQSMRGDLSEDEEDPLPSIVGGDLRDIECHDLYREWLNTPSNSPPPDAGNLFDSIASRLQISEKKRNRDKLILNDMLSSTSGVIKRGIYNFLTATALFVVGSLSLNSGFTPVSKENTFQLKTGSNEISDKSIHHFYLNATNIKPIPIDRYVSEMKKPINLKNTTPM